MERPKTSGNDVGPVNKVAVACSWRSDAVGLAAKPGVLNTEPSAGECAGAALIAAVVNVDGKLAAAKSAGEGIGPVDEEGFSGAGFDDSHSCVVPDDGVIAFDVDARGELQRIFPCLAIGGGL